MEEDHKIARLVTTSSDVDISVDFKRRIKEKLIDICSIIDEANDAGFVPDFNFGRDCFNKNTITKLILMKIY